MNHLLDIPNISTSLQIIASREQQLADVIAAIAESMEPPVKLRITSFSIAEEGIRRLFLLKEAGVVSSIELVLDFKAFQKTIEIASFLANVVDHIWLAPTHAKIALVESGDSLEAPVSVISSQNMTRGNRFEAAVIMRGLEVFETLGKDLDNLIKNEALSIDDALSRCSGEDN